MDQETLDIISTQTGCHDREEIEHWFEACDKDIVRTIMKLSNVIELPDRNKSAPSEFDEVRKIVDEKENIYFERNKGI